MKKVGSVRVAGNILLIAFGLLVIFHVLALVQVVPTAIVWGGQIGDSSINLLAFEIVSLLVTIVFTMIIAAKMGYLKAGKLHKVVTVGVWLIFAYLILNTVGNLASGVTFENLIFAPITLLLALCALRLALAK